MENLKVVSQSIGIENFVVVMVVVNRSAVVVVIVAITHKTGRMVVTFVLTSDCSVAYRVVAKRI